MAEPGEIQSATDLLEWVRDRLGQPYRDYTFCIDVASGEVAWNPELGRERVRHYRKSELYRTVLSDMSRHVGASTYNEYGDDDGLIRDLVRRLEPSMTADERRSLAQIAIGSVARSSANAMFFGSHGFYAILVNTGLFRFLHCTLSGHAALEDVDRVSEWPAYEPKRVRTVEDVKEYLEVVRRDREELGGTFVWSLKLHEPHRTHMMQQLVMCECFVIGHEIAHYLNGDLEDSASFDREDVLAGVAKYNERAAHEREIAADVRAFRLLAPRRSSTHWQALVFAQLVEFFGILAGAGVVASASHPDPMLRPLFIAHHVFGERVADLYDKAILVPEDMIAVYEAIQAMG